MPTPRVVSSLALTLVGAALLAIVSTWWARSEYMWGTPFSVIVFVCLFAALVVLVFVGDSLWRRWHPTPPPDAAEALAVGFRLMQEYKHESDELRSALSVERESRLTSEADLVQQRIENETADKAIAQLQQIFERMVELYDRASRNDRLAVSTINAINELLKPVAPDRPLVELMLGKNPAQQTEEIRQLISDYRRQRVAGLLTFPITPDMSSVKFSPIEGDDTNG